MLIGSRGQILATIEAPDERVPRNATVSPNRNSRACRCAGNALSALRLLGRHRCAQFALPEPAEQTQAAEAGGRQRTNRGSLLGTARSKG